MTDQREASEAAKRREVGYTWGGRYTGVSGNAGGDELHRKTADNRGKVGGDTSTI